MKYTTGWVIILLFVALSGPMASSAARIEELSPEEKIDRMVRDRMRSSRYVPVTILCSTQLLGMPDGYAEFCRTHNGRDRSDLRKDVVNQLKQIADNGEQQAVKRVIGRAPANQHWIINALSVRLTANQIRKVAQLEEVAYIYAGFPPLPSHRKQRLHEVIPASAQASFSFAGKEVPWNLKAIHADRVWRVKKVLGESVVVAMLEGGVDYTHQDLRNNIWINRNEIPDNGKDDDSNGWIDDYYGYNFRIGSCEVISKTQQHHHGTMTSGIVAGDGSGGIITGVAPRARIMPLSGHAVYAYEYALEQGADILSMSFSVPRQGNARALWRLMSEQAVCAGLVLVSGCGNFQQSEKIPEQIRVPEGIPCVIGAGGLTRGMKIPPFCSLGPVEWGTVRFYEDYPMPGGLTKPDVCAFPGPGYPQLAPKNGDYIQNKRGNSFSGPHIAGVAALVLSRAPELPAWQVKEILEATARDLGPEGKDNVTGAGLVDAWEAVLRAEKEEQL